MRDWLKLRPASFRGVPFRVEDDGSDRGRRVAVHEISGGERPVTEDMGRIATTFSVMGYVVGDLADAAGLRLEAACDARGPARLVLPIDSGRMVHCTGCSRNREKDRSGYIAYRLDFVVAGSAGAGLGGALGALRAVFSAAIGPVSIEIGGP